MMRLLACVLAVLALVGCQYEITPEQPWDGLCTATFAFRYTASTPRVFVAGSWNEFDANADELVDDGTGTYRGTVRLAPGLYPYKFVLRNGTNASWILDPDNSYRAYADNVENSGLRVADCRVPKLSVTTRSIVGSHATMTIGYESALGIAAQRVRVEARTPSGVRELVAPEAVVDASGNVHLDLDVSAQPRTTVRLVATDAHGTDSEPLLLYFDANNPRYRWDASVIYMIVTDRFRNGDASNDPAMSDASAGADWEGGDLRGVEDAIEDGYFENLGVNVLWLTPYNRNPEGTFTDADESHRVAGYHGYWPADPRAVDDRLGGESALVSMVRTAHSHGLRVIMDLVLNHVHEDHPYVTQHPSWFNEGCVCGTSGCDWTEHRLDCLFRPYLPDINWKNNEASEQFIADALDWMERVDLDGFRVDAVKHVDDGAIFNLAARVHERFGQGAFAPFLMGETAMGWDESAGPDAGGNVENYATISRYIGPNALNGQFDFVLYYAAAMQFLRDTPGRGMAHIDYWSRESQRQYPRGAIMTPYIGSHDTSRFVSLAGTPELAGNKWENLPGVPPQEAYDRMYVAFGWLLAQPGAPLLYYGDEYGEYGGADPDNRHMMRFHEEQSDAERAQVARVRTLLGARRNYAGLRSTTSTTLFADEDVLVVMRGEGTTRVLVVINRSAAETHRDVAVSTDVAPESETFVDLLEPEYATSVRGGVVSLDVPARSVRYLN